jgi:mono/diheme cytochrome c family protein
MSIKKIVVLLVMVFGLIQIVPYGREHSNPEIQGEPKWDSVETKELFNRACADCHSNETKWPWYSNIAPISWLVTHDVEKGREHFNVSMWGMQKKNEGDEAVEEIDEGDMPLFVYVLNHSEAKLSDEDKKVFIDGLKKTFGEKKE